MAVKLEGGAQWAWEPTAQACRGRIDTWGPVKDWVDFPVHKPNHSHCITSAVCFLYSARIRRTKHVGVMGMSWFWEQQGSGGSGYGAPRVWASVSRPPSAAGKALPSGTNTCDLGHTHPAVFVALERGGQLCG